MHKQVFLEEIVFSDRTLIYEVFSQDSDEFFIIIRILFVYIENILIVFYKI